MPDKSPPLFTFGAFLMAFTIVLDAFAAHGLKTRLDTYSIEIFYTATRYQLIHSLALLVLDGTSRLGAHAKRRALTFFSFGIFLFSGSLYLLSLTGIKKFGMITPFGGMSFILGWAYIGWSALAGKNKS